MSATMIVPPGGDPSLRPVWPAPHQLLEPGRSFVARVLHDRGAASAPAALPEQAARLRAAAAALADPGLPLERLRGAALLMRTLTELDDRCAVRVTLDDIALADGSTEDSAAALRGARGPAPYGPELDDALAKADGADGVWIILDRDQQLPAAAFLAERLSDRARVIGRYARTHWGVLGRLAAFRAATLSEPAARVHWRVAGLPGLPGEGPQPEERPPVYWRERAADPVPPGRWAGRVGLRALAERTDELIAGGCTTAVLGVCAADRREMVGRGGTTLPTRQVTAAAARLRAAGVTVLAELWLGAPGVGAQRAADTAGTLDAPDSPVDRVAGLRPFDWPTHWSDPRWGPVTVRLHPSGGLDLARHGLFEAPGTLPPEQVAELVSEIGPRLARTGQLVPARIATAYLVTDPEDAAPGKGVGLAPGVRLVTVDSSDGQQWYAVDLRVGRVLRLDPRVGRRLRVGRRPAAECNVLPGTPDATRTRLLDALVGNGLLVRR